MLPRILLLLVIATGVTIASLVGAGRGDAGPVGQPSQVSGTVLNHFGKPAQGASVSALNDDSCPSGCGLSSTDANGHWESTIQPGTYIFQVGGLTIGSIYDGNAFWTSHGSVTDKSEAGEVVITTDQNITLDFMLPGTGGLTWQVTDGTGDTIPYPEIVIEGGCNCTPTPFNGGQFGTSTASLPTGLYTLSASAPGYARTYWTASGGTTNAALAESVRVCASRTTVIGIQLQANAVAGVGTPIPVPTPTEGCPEPYAFEQFTSVAADEQAGANQIYVREMSFMFEGDLLLIGGGTAQAEVLELTAKAFATPTAPAQAAPQGHAQPGKLTFSSPLAFTHANGDSVDEVFNGDVNCDGSRTLADVPSLLGGLQGVRRVPAGCPSLGEATALGEFGDVDCGGDVSELDGLYFLAWWVDLPAEAAVRCLDL